MRNMFLAGTLAALFFGASPTEAKADTWGYFFEEVDIVRSGSTAHEARLNAEQEFQNQITAMYWFYLFFHNADEVFIDSTWTIRSSYTENGVRYHRIRGYVYIDVLWYSSGGGGTPPSDDVFP